MAKYYKNILSKVLQFPDTTPVKSKADVSFDYSKLGVVNVQELYLSISLLRMIKSMYCRKKCESLSKCVRITLLSQLLGIVFTAIVVKTYDTEYEFYDSFPNNTYSIPYPFCIKISSIRWRILRYIRVSQFGTHLTITYWKKFISMSLGSGTQMHSKSVDQVRRHPNHLKKTKTQSIKVWIEETTYFDHVLGELDKSSSSLSLTKTPKSHNVIDPTWDTSDFFILKTCFS